MHIQRNSSRQNNKNTKWLNNYTNSTVPPKILVAGKLFTEFPTFYGTYQYIVVFKRPCHFLSQMDTVHRLPSYSFQIHFNINLLSPHRSSTWFIFFKFFYQNLGRIYLLFHAFNMLSSSHPPSSVHPNDILQGSHHSIFHTPCFFYLGSKIPVSSLVYRLPLTWDMNLDIWIKVDQLDDTCFIMSIYCSTCFGC